MLKKICNYLLQNKIQFLRYVVVGLSGFLIDISTLYALSKIYNINPTIAVVFNQMIVLAYNFTLNRLWTFGGGGTPQKQLVRYLILMFCNYFLSVILMYIFNEIWGIDEILVRIGSIALMVLWNFALYKTWVYKS
jgi:putative flippase GtrA